MVKQLELNKICRDECVRLGNLCALLGSSRPPNVTRRIRTITAGMSLDPPAAYC